MTPAPRNLIRALKARAIIDDPQHPQHAQVVDAVDTALELDPPMVRVIDNVKLVSWGLTTTPLPHSLITAVDRVQLARRNVAAMTQDEFYAACEAIGLPIAYTPRRAAKERGRAT